MTGACDVESFQHEVVEQISYYNLVYLRNCEFDVATHSDMYSANFLQDFNRAANVYESLCQKDVLNRGNLLSAVGRIYLQLGDLKSAQALFKRVEELTTEDAAANMAKMHMNK